MNSKSKTLYDLINGFIATGYIPEELTDVHDLFAADSVCGQELERIYRKRSELLDAGVSESDLDVIFDGFERIMREIGEVMYTLGEQGHS